MIKHCLFHLYLLFFFNHTSTTEIYTLSLHDALPILVVVFCSESFSVDEGVAHVRTQRHAASQGRQGYRIYPHAGKRRSEEHTSELQSPDHLVCRLLLEKKKKKKTKTNQQDYTT